MKRLLVTLALVSLVLPAAALGKGPSEAVVSGPGDGGGGGITFKGCCSPGTPTMQLAEAAGFFPAVFTQEPDPMLDRRPAGALGPKYTITYTVPGPNNDTFTIRQDVYPYAKNGAVTYLAPGQRIFDTKTRGGWYQAASDLKETLVAGGLPASAPSPGSSDGGWSFPTLALGIVALLLVAAAAAVVVVTRRGARMAGSPT